jgi:hypothetical protein
MTTRENRFPPGWDEARVQAVLDHYERQSEEEAVAEDEADLGDPSPSPALPGGAGRAEAVRELASLSLPVGTPEEIVRESVP